MNEEIVILEEERVRKKMWKQRMDYDFDKILAERNTTFL